MGFEHEEGRSSLPERTPAVVGWVAGSLARGQVPAGSWLEGRRRAPGPTRPSTGQCFAGAAEFVTGHIFACGPPNQESQSRRLRQSAQPRPLSTMPTAVMAEAGTQDARARPRKVPLTRATHCRLGSAGCTPVRGDVTGRGVDGAYISDGLAHSEPANCSTT